MVEPLSVHGPRGSGTRWLRYTLKENLDAEVATESDAWPHAPPRGQRNAVCVLKNPWSWIPSYLRVTHAARDEVPSVSDLTLDTVRSLTEKWVLFLDACMARRSPRTGGTVTIVAYHAVLVNPSRMLDRFLIRAGYRAPEEWSVTPYEMVAGSQPGQERFDDSRYRDAEYLEAWDEERIKAVWDALDSYPMTVPWRSLGLDSEDPTRLHEELRG